MAATTTATTTGGGEEDEELEEGRTNISIETRKLIVEMLLKPAEIVNDQQTEHLHDVEEGSAHNESADHVDKETGDNSNSNSSDDHCDNHIVKCSICLESLLPSTATTTRSKKSTKPPTNDDEFVVVQGRSGSCSHRFHRACIVNWLVTTSPSSSNARRTTARTVTSNFIGNNEGDTSLSNNSPSNHDGIDDGQQVARGTSPVVAGTATTAAAANNTTAYMNIRNACPECRQPMWNHEEYQQAVQQVVESIHHPSSSSSSSS